MLMAVALGAAPGAIAQTSDLAKPRSSLEIVLDSSRAMGRERLATAVRAIGSAMRAMPEGTPVGLRVYGGNCSDSRSVVPVTPADPAAVRTATRNLKAAGLAPLSLALSRAGKDLPATGERTVLLVAGGADSCAPPPACQTVTLGSATPPLRVDVIGFEANAAARRALQCIVRRTGGVYADAATPAALMLQLEAARERATRDRRSLGTPLAGGLEQQQATPAKPGQYVDSIAPDSERWYHVPVPSGYRLDAVATLVAPPTGDVSAPGSSLTLDAFGAGRDATVNATNLFAFDPSRSITLGVTPRSTQGGSDVRVALHDTPDKQLAQKLGGRSLALELLFRLTPVGSAGPAKPAKPVAASASRDVTWGAAVAAGVVCALIAFASLALFPRRAREEV
jgi:Ca-activated chloride channel family protein